MAKFCNLFSGSKGNSTYVGVKDKGIIIDAGRSAKQILSALKDREIEFNHIEGIFITHEHSDHISALAVLLKNYKIPIYATKGTLLALNEKNVIPMGNPYVTMQMGERISCADMEIAMFPTSHDSAQSCGFRIKTPDEREIAICTDLGFIDDIVYQGINGCDFVMIESNHDKGMLQNGGYPYYLKKRILSERGHLSNDSCAEILPQLVKGGTTRIALAHLSNENNIPALAKTSAENHLIQNGIDMDDDCLLGVLEETSTKGVTIF